MKLVSYLRGGLPSFGAIEGDDVVDMAEGSRVPTLKAWLADPDPPRLARSAGARTPLAAVTLLPPIPDPTLILCVATNFREPGREAEPPAYPLLFTRTASAQVGHGDAILKPAVSDKLDFEGELAVIIGRPGRHIAQADAMKYVAGYSCFNDGSVRDWQKHSSQFTQGKNFYRSGGFGPSLVTSDEVPDPYALMLETRVNGVVKQSVALAAMIFRIDWLIAYCSTFTALSVGDVIATGTPSGFGTSRNPPEFLRAGDQIEVDIPGVGLLRNVVRADDGAIS